MTDEQPPQPEAARRPVIALLTDFGLADHYVGVMHGVLLTIAREAAIVDLCHDVAAQDVRGAAFLLGCSWRYFPSDTIHVVVVDPGVGGERTIIAVQSQGGLFMGPDNGVLSAPVRDQSGALPLAGGRVPVSRLGDDLVVRLVSNAALWLPEVSRTFHGRDIFAPVAGHLASGMPIEEVGPPADDVLLLPVSLPEWREDGVILAHVVHVDRFGNLTTDLTAEVVRTLGGKPRFAVRDRVVEGLSNSYSAGPELLALVGSAGRIELARRDGSAAEALAVQVGDVVEVRGGD